MTAVMLAVVVMCGTVMGSYQETQAAEIVAGEFAFGALEEILLSFGIFLLPTASAGEATDPSYWRNGNNAQEYLDYLEKTYNLIRVESMNNPPPQPSPTPVPEQKPEIQPTPVPEVKPGEIPTFDELVAPALAGGAISWASGAWDTMAKAVGNLWDKIFGTVSNVPDSITVDDVNLIAGSGCSYYFIFDYTVYGTKSHQIALLKKYPYIVGSTIYFSSGKYYADGNYRYDYNTSTHIDFSGDRYSNVITNVPEFSSISDAVSWAQKEQSNANKYTKENIWVHPDLQETYQNNGKLEYPQEAPQPLQYPSAENLADLAKKLNPEINPDYSPEIAPNYVQELIQKLQQDPSVNPDPNPNPNPNPDPGTDPQPTLKPNPTGTPENPTPEEEASPYKADLREIFPFCIPFDLIHLLKVFEADAEAPVFEFPLDIELDNPWTGEKVVDYHHTFELDMSDYEPVIKILRIFQVVFFIIALMLITRQQMIKG